MNKEYNVNVSYHATTETKKEDTIFHCLHNTSCCWMPKPGVARKFTSKYVVYMFDIGQVWRESIEHQQKK